jgi:hypothetical protein
MSRRASCSTQKTLDLQQFTAVCLTAVVAVALVRASAGLWVDGDGAVVGVWLAGRMPAAGGSQRCAGIVKPAAVFLACDKPGTLLLDRAWQDR